MTPQVELDFQVHWCARHLEPFRANWPKGACLAMVKLAEEAIADERIVAAAPHDREGRAQAGALDAVLREHSPLCCFVSAVALARVYAYGDMGAKAESKLDGG